MRPGVKLAAFALVLAVAFGVGAAVGAVVGPIEVTETTGHPAGHEGVPSTTSVVHPDGHEAPG